METVSQKFSFGERLMIKMDMFFSMMISKSH